MGWMCWSAERAVSVRRGSITITCAPRFWAWRSSGMKCGPVLAGLWPQISTSLLCSTSAGSGDQRAPSVASTAVSAAAPQIARSSPLAPMRFHSRAPQIAFCSRPSVPL